MEVDALGETLDLVAAAAALGMTEGWGLEATTALWTLNCALPPLSRERRGGCVSTSCRMFRLPWTTSDIGR